MKPRFTFHFISLFAILISLLANVIPLDSAQAAVSNSAQWIWVDGSNTKNQAGTYGTEDVPGINNIPGARQLQITWTDASGNLWLFGGYGSDSAGTVGALNDLWKFNPASEQWTWVDGANTVNQAGVYGTEDVPAASNIPGARYSSVSWVDASGNLWLFGGDGLDSAGTLDKLNDLWKFNPNTGQWTWVDGSNLVNQTGVYGTEDAPDVNNVPGARTSSTSWVDAAGNLWLFGGGYGIPNYLNDLWKFDPVTGQWTWVDGSNTVNQIGVYGTEDTPAANNVPGARFGSVSWLDASGNLWLFSGGGYDGFGPSGILNDLWMFTPATGQWTWVDGSNTINQSGIYGVEDTPDVNNVPGGRDYATSWLDASGKLWLFSGIGYDSAGATGYLHDLWKFDPATGQWTWADGPNTRNQSGVYGTEDISNANNGPGGRSRSATWFDGGGNLWLFGGYGFDSAGATGLLNDLWKFSLPSQILYVQPTPAGAKDCTTWANACSLAAALNYASNGDQIWVAAGTHTPHASDRSATFQLKNGVAIYGGFNGTETQLNQRSPLANLTILSGDLSGNDGPNFVNNGENSYHVVTGSYTNNTASMDGFTITGGNANGDSWPNYNGGGMINYQGSPTLTNLTFLNNYAVNGGGGMINDSNTDIVLSQLTFSGNSAGTGAGGGGMINWAVTNLTLTNSTFSGNITTGNGGGLYHMSGTQNLINATFSANSAAVNGDNLMVAGGTTNMKNTILANGVHGKDCTGIIATAANNLIKAVGLDACSLVHNVNGNIIGQDPQLGPLAQNGGVTQTMLLSLGNPAINAGTNSGCPTTDQRGLPRDAQCDIGAFEYTDSTAPTVTSILRASTNPTTASSVSYTVTFSESVTGVDVADFSLNTSGLTGSSVAAVSGSGASYTVTVYTASASSSGSLRLEVPNTASITDLFSNPLSGLPFTGGETYTVNQHLTFEDVPFNYWAWKYIESLYNSGITGGCTSTPLNYCPGSSVTRAQMSVFLLKGIHGSSYTPPAVNGSTGFNDVDSVYWAAAWIKQLAAEGITSGCGAGVYCPEATVTRAQMAVFLLKAKHGSSYIPPNATGVFSDVPVGYWADKWIERLAAEGVTSGCGAGIYCPDAEVTRAQMAVFLVRAFNLP